MTRNLHIGLVLPTSAPVGMPVDVAAMGATAEWAEAKGFDSVWVADHVFHPVQLLECLTTVAYVAARTKRVQLGTGVLLMPMRQLSILAKQVANLALLSEGRFILGVGVGGEWPAEWIAAGVPLTERGPRLDEALPLLQRLIDGETVDFAGRFNTLPSVRLTPAPPPVPIWFAGRAQAALERAAKYGEGWLGYLLSVNGFRQDRDKLVEARARAGLADKPFTYGMNMTFRFDKTDDGAPMRAALALNAAFPPGLALTPPEKLQNFVVAGTSDAILARLHQYIEAGCEMFCFNAPGYGQEARDQMEMLVAEVLPKLRAL